MRTKARLANRFEERIDKNKYKSPELSTIITHQEKCRLTRVTDVTQSEGGGFVTP
jgi:hypothetical protein